MKIIIPVAGKGARLKPHTHTKPKPLLNVAGKPILEHIIDLLKGMDFSEVIFITGHLRDNIEDYVRTNFSFASRFIYQEKMDGTAGAIKLAKDYVHEDVLILFADTISDVDFKIIEQVKNNDLVDGLMWVKEVEDYKRFGVVVTDTDGMITRIIEKPHELISKLANIGFYYIKNSKLLFEGIEQIYSKGTSINGEYFLTDAFTYMIEKGCKIQIVNVNEWLDCGKFETLLETNRTLLERNHEILSQEVDSKIIPPVYIGKNVVIERSVIGPYVSIANGAKIHNSNINNSIIDSNAELRNVILTMSTVSENAGMKDKCKIVHIGDSSEIDME